MYKFNDIRLNEILKTADSYTFGRNESPPKDSKDKMVGAVLIDAEFLKSIKKKPNETVVFNDQINVNLEIGKYLTTNGKLIKKETFENVYKKSSAIVVRFLQERSKSNENMLDIIEQLYGKKNSQKTNTPKFK